MNIGFIGMGNMAQALASGFIFSGKVKKENIFAFAPNQEKLKKNASSIGFTPCEDIALLVRNCDFLILACKPFQIEDVLSKVKDELLGKALVSIAAGWVHENFTKILSNSVRIQCIIPNTPAMIGEGVILFEKTTTLTEDELSFAKDIFSSLGLIEELPTHLMSIGGAISGCGPAFMDMIIESYSDAAVKYGIPRKTAYNLVSQTMAGSAKLQLKTGKHPGELKDEVCSPSGTTIRGVSSLEKDGLRGICISSIDAVMEK